MILDSQWIKKAILGSTRCFFSVYRITHVYKKMQQFFYVGTTILKMFLNLLFAQIRKNFISNQPNGTTYDTSVNKINFC